MENKQMESKKAELNRGVIVLLALAVFTGLEYLLGTLQFPAIFLWLIALVKAGTVMWFFMHIKRVFSANEGDHS